MCVCDPLSSFSEKCNGHSFADKLKQQKLEKTDELPISISTKKKESTMKNLRQVFFLPTIFLFSSFASLVVHNTEYAENKIIAIDGKKIEQFSIRFECEQHCMYFVVDPFSQNGAAQLPLEGNKGNEGIYIVLLAVHARAFTFL